jgi:PAS domain S-box-containing protein
MWEKIILNLLSNAFKYTFVGEIAICLRWCETYVALTVRDTGTGIPAHALPHLFERFYHLPNARARTHEGTGIGLALVQELVRLHGGQITVASTVDVGTTFTVTIPTGAGHLPADRVGGPRHLVSTALATDAYAAEALRWLPEETPRPHPVASPLPPVPVSPLPPVPASALPPGSAPPRIHVADDNADMRAYVQRLLSPHWQVEAVADGVQALAVARARVPDLVLTDIMMPGLDGFALLRALRADPRTATLPVLLLSARAGEEARVEGLAAGADDYLVKPFAARELLARVEAHLTLKRLRDETQATVHAYATQLEHALAALQRREEDLRQHNDLLLATRREIEQERARYAALFALAPEGALVTDAAGVIQEANPAAAALLGAAPSALMGTPLRRYITQTQRRSFARLLTRLQTQARAQDWETHLQPRHGRPMPASLTVAVRRSPAGQAPALHWLLRDITARKQAEAELERRRQETVLLAELAQELSASLDLDTVLQRIVTGAQALCGSARTLIALRDPGTEVLVSRYAMGAATLASADWRLAPGEGLGGQVLRTGQPWRTADYATDPRFSKVERAGARAAGPLAVLAVPIRMAGRVEGVLYASKPAVQPFTDWDEAILVRLATHAALALQNAQLYQQAQAELAERRTAEAALARAAAELEQRVAERTAALHEAMAERQRLEREAQRVQHFALLGRLAAGVSHEIRNPLAAVFLHVDVLAEELGDPAPDSAALVADTLTDIRTQLGRLEDLVQDYLSLVRVAQLERIPEDLGAALRTWAMEWQALAIARGHLCQLAGLDDVGMVAVHANTLRRALLNLVQNALDAMPQGGTLTLRGSRTATAVVLQVQDTGSGIPPATSSQIFEPLYTTKPVGTGLGLYIVQEIVAAHGGQVTVESVVGQGTTFTLTLPLGGGASDAACAP